MKKEVIVGLLEAPANSIAGETSSRLMRALCAYQLKNRK
jgi:hypothetical protein